MKFWIAIIGTIFFLAFSFRLQSQDFSLLEKRIFQSEKGVLPYRILFPENYDKSVKYPLVLFLHGGGERGDDNEKHLVHGVKHFLEPANRRAYPCILIVPQCPEDSYWASVKFERTKYPLELDFNYAYDITRGLQLAIDLTKNIIKSEAVDKKRVYITGMSMGGMGTLEAVYRILNFLRRQPVYAVVLMKWRIKRDMSVFPFGSFMEMQIRLLPLTIRVRCWHV